MCRILATKACNSWTAVESYHGNNGEVWAGYCHVAFWRPPDVRTECMEGSYLELGHGQLRAFTVGKHSPNNYVPVVDSVHM